MPQLTLQVSRLLHPGVPHSSSTWLWAKHQRVGISPWCRYQESTSLPSLQACLQAEALSSFLAQRPCSEGRKDVKPTGGKECHANCRSVV